MYSQTTNRKVLGLQVVAGGRRQLVTSFLLCFGGGVMLSVTMLHILPEIGEQLEARAGQLELECLPQLLVCCGFFFIYLVEELVDFILGKIRHSEPLHQTVAMRNPRNSVCAEESK